MDEASNAVPLFEGQVCERQRTVPDPAVLLPDSDRSKEPSPVSFYSWTAEDSFLHRLQVETAAKSQRHLSVTARLILYSCTHGNLPSNPPVKSNKLEFAEARRYRVAHEPLCASIWQRLLWGWITTKCKTRFPLEPSFSFCLHPPASSRLGALHSCFVCLSEQKCDVGLGHVMTLLLSLLDLCIRSAANEANAVRM